MNSILMTIKNYVSSFSVLALPAFLLLCGVMVVALLLSNFWGALMIAALLYALAVYADLPRQIPEGAGMVLAPLDGYVLAREMDTGLPFEFETAKDQSETFAKVSMRQSLRMSRVLRTPVSGTVQEIIRVPRQGPAALPWMEMDQALVLFAALDGREYALALRAPIVPHQIRLTIKPGDVLRAGDRIGIVWGLAAADVYVPNAAPLIKDAGQILVAGETVMQTPAWTQAPGFRTV